MHSLFIKIRYYLDIKIYPWHYCKLCGILNAKLICEDCCDNLATIKAECYYSNSVWFFDKVHLGFKYQNPLRKLLHEFKYNKKLHLSWHLGYLLYKHLITLNLEEVDYIIPVPTHRLKEKERGFNQVLLMLNYYIIYNKQPHVSLDIVIKVKYTKTQVNYSFNERSTNIANSFKVLKNLTGKRILVIDDVFTTGSTINELSKVLKQSGASKVEALCLMGV